MTQWRSSPEQKKKKKKLTVKQSHSPRSVMWHCSIKSVILIWKTIISVISWQAAYYGRFLPLMLAGDLHINFNVQFVTFASLHAKLLYVMPSQIVASSLSHREQSYGKGYFSPGLTVKQLLHHLVKKHYNSSECASAIIADFYGTRYRE